MVGLLIDELFLGHRADDAGAAGHPERPERLLAVQRGLESIGAPSRSRRLPIRAARMEELAAVHTPQYLAELERRVPGRSGFLDADTFFSPGTWDAALAAAAGAIDAALASLDGLAPRGLVVVRPPG